MQRKEGVAHPLCCQGSWLQQRDSRTISYDSSFLILQSTVLQDSLWQLFLKVQKLTNSQVLTLFKVFYVCSMNQSSKISCKYEYLHLTQNDVGYTAGKLLPRVRLTGENCLHLQLTVYTETLPLASLTGPYYSTVFINMTLLFQETPGQEDISYK